MTVTVVFNRLILDIDQQTNPAIMQKSREEEEDLLTAFQMFDAENKGYIESRALREVLRYLGASIPSGELRQMFQDMDLEIDRHVPFEGRVPSYEQVET